ncbi:uncharacterized protein LOC143199516 [Rhynchophorus ferrugineus]|uniref:uncharacterized protein LOC143199516 n=1 Tax=Rhynchophorus ferrugineus TaxID=354439 RepID=UPI003FCD3775
MFSAVAALCSGCSFFSTESCCMIACILHAFWRCPTMVGKVAEQLAVESLSWLAGAASCLYFHSLFHEIFDVVAALLVSGYENLNYSYRVETPGEPAVDEASMES